MRYLSTAMIGTVALLSVHCTDGSTGIPTRSGGATGTATGGAPASGGATGSGGGNQTGSGGASNSGGSTGMSGGSSGNSGGASGTGGSGTATGGSGTATGGSTGSGGAMAGGGATGSGGAGAGTGGAAGGSTGLRTGPFKMLVMSTSLEFGHDSIPTCLKMLQDLGKATAPERAKIAGLGADTTWTVDQMGSSTGAANYFSEVTADNLKNYEMFYSNNPTDPNSGKIAVIRVRSGFVQNVLGFNLSKEVKPGYKIGGRFALWVGASNERKPVLGQHPSVEAREVFVQVDAPWGTIQAGRTLGLFGRGGILMDGEIVHANGLGSPCSTRSILGGACGFAGHGALFPAFNAGFLYSTPSLGGFQITGALFDPSVNSEKAYEITPYPRLEAQIAYRFRNVFKVFAEAMWQRLINSSPITDPVTHEPILDTNGRPKNQVADVSGISAGAQLAVGPLQVGGSFYQGKGLTLIVPIFNTPILTDENKILRPGLGFVGMASLTFGGTKIAGGAGISQLKLTSAEMPPYSQLVPPKQQLGISIGLYQTFFKQLTWAIEYFRGQYTWYDYRQGIDTPIVSPKQTVNFINTGLTLVF